MNKIYRTLWNAATQSWVVVSELAKAGGKSASGKSALVNSVSGFSFTLIAASVVLGSGQVNAAEVTGTSGVSGDGNYCFFDANSKTVICGDGTTKTEDKADNKPAKSVVMGVGATNKGESNVAIGVNSKTENATAAIAVGASASAKANYAIAVGFEAEGNGQWDISIGRFAGKGASTSAGEGRNIAIGDGALKDGKNVNNNIALGTGAGDQFEGTHSLIMGTYANTNLAVTSAITAGTKESEFGNGIIKTTDNNKDTYHVKANNVVALGHRALAANLAAIAIGQQAKAFGNQSVATGNGTKASGETAIATGSNAYATGASAIAIGGSVNATDAARTFASGDFSIAMGRTAQATKSDTIAFGRNATAAGNNTISIGYNAGVTKTADEAQGDPNSKLEPATDAVFIGNKAGYKSNQNRMQVSLGKDSGEGVVGTENVTIGNSAGKNTKGNTNVAISSRAGQNVEGHDNFAALIEAGQNIKGSDNIAIGKHAGRSADANAKLNISNTISLGRESVSLKNFGIAQGNKAKTDGLASIAIGRNAEAVGGETANIAIGDSASADASGAIVLGTKAQAKSLTVDGKKYGAYSAIVIGTEAKAIAQAAPAGKNENPKDAIAIGTKAEAHYASTIALGFGAKSDTKAQAVSIGYNSNAKGYQAIAFGSEAKTTENAGSSIAFGTKAQTRASASIAIGMGAETGFDGGQALDGSDAVALGREAKAKRQNALAFGYKAVADHKDAVALGAGAETAEAVGTNEATVNEFKYSGFAGIKPIATVSVGKKDAERTITNVAAGRIDKTSTDAINGSQLYLALNTLGYVGNTLVSNVLGGNAAIVKEGDNAGTLTMSNIGGTGADTIDAAIAAVKTQAAQKTQVVAGDNITVTQGGTAENPTYTVATKKDVKFDSVIAGGDEGGTKIDKDGLTFVNKDGNKVENSPSITKTGIDAGNQKVTNVKNGDVAKDSKDAVNGGQLFAQGEGVKNIIGGNTTYDPATGTYTNADIGGTGASTIHDAIAAINTSAKAAKTEVVEGDNIVVTSTDGANGNKIYKVATAKEVTFDKTTVGSVVTDKTTNDIKGLSNTALGGDNFAKNGRAASEEQLNATQTNLATLLGGNAQNTNGNVTMTDIGGTGKNNINDAIKASRNEVKQGKNMVVTPTIGANGQTIYEVATADKVAFDEVKVGGITIDGATNKISGIAKGEVSETSTDAVNGSQLHELSKQIMNQSGQGYNILNNRINKVDKDLRAGIAGANAAAGLPQAYIPGKSMVAVAAGTYKGQNAIALGMSRISDNGKVIIKLTGNTNSRGDFGASIGAGYQW
ncbi:TPA: YadA-like family protein [Pasteurella multocida]|uniref:YadA-like family protein n=1 Tax=Pasteurella multocida TaxID=747 RepID=UPI002020ABD1|nr:YadA-like family protein [Pasteurella multocida]MCL7840405.1 YadA-like family protein [Pasteurella multocida]HDR1186116.1 YadA-like family protein [Pasteurella multocida]HDR1793703.1 YadA-like family protein [Pasteurella multocida]HDR1892958.1 YadA-like family protein [Pasteurella multocida]HED4465579.1 YadA-like family protein [Pasteurella multocida]